MHDHDDGYGVPVGALCAAAARERGLRRARGRSGITTSDGRRRARRRAVLYVGVAGSGAVGLWHGLHALDPALWLLGTDGVAAPWLARRAVAGAAERTRFFAAQLAPVALYGFEAMALILDAVAAGDGDRAGDVRAARPTPSGAPCSAATPSTPTG